MQVEIVSMQVVNKVGERDVVRFGGQVLYNLERIGDADFDCALVSYFAIFQQSQADNVLESKIVPPRMASSTSASERTTG